MPIRDVVSRFVDLKSFIGSVAGVLITLGSTYSYISVQIDQWSDKAADRFYETISEKIQEDEQVYEHFTELSYDITKFGLMKQLEKITNDPEDIKDMDLLFYAGVCDKNIYFNLEYIPNSEYSRGLRIACNKILELNDKRYGE